MNLLIVDRVRLVFGPGLTVISGETGAGKSLLLDALDLVLGGKASSAMVGARAEEAVVGAVFTIEDTVAQSLDSELGVPCEDGQIILRRKIRKNGRSQAWINDVPVGVAALRQCSEMMVRVHQQGAHVRLGDPAVQMELLDGYGGHRSVAEAYRQSHARVNELQSELKGLASADQGSLRELDFLRFQEQEIAAVEPESGEFAKLEAEQKLLAGAEEWRSVAHRAVVDLVEGDMPLQGSIAAVAERCRGAPDADLEEAADLLTQAAECVRDAGLAASRAADRISGDPERLAAVDARLASLVDLLRKYGGTEESLLNEWKSISERIAELSGLDERKAQLVKDLAQAEKSRLGKGAKLAKAREKAFAGLSKALVAELKGLGMPRTRFLLGTEEGSPNAQGSVRQSILASMNPGVEPGPMSEVPSGGEAARLSLALGAVAGKVDAVPVLIFDEVDSGVGGRLGMAIAQRLQSIATQDRSVVAISHTPQVAAAADRHLVVRKSQGKASTTVDVQMIAGDERETELAEMLGGGAAALQQAKALLIEGSR